MKSNKVAIELLKQLSELLKQLDNDTFSLKMDVLSGSTIGQHIRHTLEFFDILKAGVKVGELSYDKREHNSILQENISNAISKIDEIIIFLSNSAKNIDLTLEVEYPISGVSCNVKTNLEREIIYNIEHLVHHMALLKIGLRENFKNIIFPTHFGVAQSTVVFQENEA